MAAKHTPLDLRRCNSALEFLRRQPLALGLGQTQRARRPPLARTTTSVTLSRPCQEPDSFANPFVARATSTTQGSHSSDKVIGTWVTDVWAQPLWVPHVSDNVPLTLRYRRLIHNTVGGIERRLRKRTGQSLRGLSMQMKGRTGTGYANEGKEKFAYVSSVKSSFAIMSS